MSWRKERVGENVLEGEIMQCNAGKQSITHSKGNSSIPLEYKKTENTYKRNFNFELRILYVKQ